MGKKFKSKEIERVCQMMEQEAQEVNTKVNKFYPDGIIANFSPSSAEQPLAALLQKAKTPLSPQDPTQEQLKEICVQIRYYIQQGKPGNAECQLHRGRQLSDKYTFPLGNIVVKVIPMDNGEPKYFFVKAGDILNTSIFLGGNNATGIMVMQDENGDDYFLRLSEFHLLSLRENPDPRKEVGLMTSYNWLTAKVYTGILSASSLDPVKSLLLSEWLQTEWQRAKDSALNPSTKSADGGGE